MGIFTHWPNRITAIRFFGALVLFILLALVGDREVEDIGAVRPWICVAFWLFVLSAVTDILDGYLARRDHVVTAFGRVADSFTDKVLIVGTMVFLAVMPWSRPWLPAWIVVVILAREFLVTGIRGFAESQGREFPADGYGKAKMWLQSFAVGSLLWLQAYEWSESLFSFWSATVHFFVWGSLLATLGSGLSYVRKFGQLFSGELV